MDNKQLEEFIKTIDPELDVRQGKNFAEITVTPDKLHSLLTRMKDEPDMQFDFLDSVTGVDRGQELGVIYHLRSTVFGHMAVVKVYTADRENPNFDSVYDLWKTADFFEREVYDLLGVKFNGHPDLRRLFLDSSWGFPLRKDYKDDINIVTK